MSRANTHSRRSQWKTTAVVTVPCPRCKGDTRPHQACPKCGTYRGRFYTDALRSEFEDA